MIKYLSILVLLCCSFHSHSQQFTTLSQYDYKFFAVDRHSVWLGNAAGLFQLDKDNGSICAFYNSSWQEAPKGDWEMRILDVNQRTYHAGQYGADEKELRLNVEALPSGLYILWMSSGGKTWTRKWIKR